MTVWVVSMVDLSRHDAGRTHLLEKWSGVAARGHDVVLWAFARELAPVWSGLAVRVPGRVRVPGLSGVSYALSLLADLLRQLRRDSPDAIYVRASPPTLLVALVLSRLTRIPIVIEAPGPIVEEARLYGVSGRKLTVIRAVFGRALRGAAAVVVVTDGIARQLVAEYRVPEQAVHVVANGVNAETFAPRPVAEARARLGIEHSARIVGFVGNLHAWQGAEYLVEAAPAILGSVPGAEIHIVGDGVTRGSLERAAARLGVADLVLFHGPVPYEAVPDYISACDVLVAPLVPKPTGDSGYSPLKLYEYLSCGRPVVASRLEGLEIVEREGLGRLVPPADADALARAVVGLLGDERMRSKMGERARLVAVERFAWTRAAERTIAILESVERRR